MLTVEDVFEKIGYEAHRASQEIALLSTENRNHLLHEIGKNLIKEKEFIIRENQKDISLAEIHGIKPVMIDRLQLNEDRLKDIYEGIEGVISLEDPLHKVLEEIQRPNGLLIKKLSVPIGVVLMIYESRPNVTVDAAMLALKSGNAVILRGGKEAINTNKALVEVIRNTITSEGYNPNMVQLVTITEREALTDLLRMRQYIDVVIPRGGAGLIKRVVNESLIPVIETGSGVCHTYVDASANKEMARKIILNAKVQRPSVCNAMETLLIHNSVAKEIMDVIAEDLLAHKVELRCHESLLEILKNTPYYEHLKIATDEDWYSEYNDLILSIKGVTDLDEAIFHINTYGTKHSEAIISEDEDNVQNFMNKVDASTVYANASTRFTDGYEFGFGSEIGISTQKLHARGPMGLNALTTYKYFVFGDGQIRK